MATLAEIKAHLAAGEQTAAQRLSTKEDRHFADVRCSRYESSGGRASHDWRVWFAFGIVVADCCSDIENKVDRLHDHKGTLHVICRKQLSRVEKAAFISAWRRCNEDQVEFHGQTSREACAILALVREPILTTHEFVEIVHYGLRKEDESANYVIPH